MQSLFPSGEQGGARETSKTLPEEMRQLIVDLHAEMPTMSWREIAEVCYIRHGRKPDHKSVKHIATSGPPPSLQARRYQPWHQIGVIPFFRTLFPAKRGRADCFTASSRCKEAFSSPFMSAHGPQECFLCCQTPS